MNRTPFETTFNYTLQPLSQMIKNRWDILNLEGESYRQPKTPIEMNGNNDIIHQKPTMKSIKSFQPYNSTTYAAKT